MNVRNIIIILLIALARTASAGPASDHLRNDRSATGGGTEGMNNSDYIFTYTSQGGAKSAKDMQMWETSLIVDSRSGLAVLEMNRDHADDAGQAIGRFEMSVARETVDRLRTLLGSTSFSGLEAAGTYEMSNESLLTFTHTTSGNKTVKIVGSGERGSMKLLEPLMEEVHKLQYELRSHPKATLKLEVRHVVRDKREYFELAFVNNGREPVYLAIPDERSTGSEWSGVKVAAFQDERRGTLPGPPNWEKIPLLHEQRTDAGTGSVRIEPGKSHVMLSRPWQPERCGVPYGAQGVMINYQGAGKEKVSPLIRGGLFSNVISVVSCKDGDTIMSGR